MLVTLIRRIRQPWALVAFATIACNVHATPDIYVWPDVVRMCNATTVSGGPETTATRVAFNRNIYPITVVNRGTSELRVTSIPIVMPPFSSAGGITKQVNGGNFVRLETNGAADNVAQAPANFSIHPDVPANPLLPRSHLEGTTNCLDALGNAVSIPPGGSCQINLRQSNLQLSKGGSSGGGSGSGGGGPWKFALRVLSNDPATPTTWVTIYVNEPGCRPGGVVSPQPTTLTNALYHGMPRSSLDQFDAARQTKECSCEGQSVRCSVSDGPNGIVSRRLTGGSTPLVYGTGEACGDCCATYLNWACVQSLIN